MKITMLGISGSGKTAYMSAMSQLFYHAAIDKYKIADRNNTYAGDGFTHKEFGKINTLPYGKFPDGTASSTIMTLELQYGNEKVIDIDWIDYRGGAIEELANGDMSEQNAVIYTTLLASDVIMVFVDTAVLQECNNEMVAREYVGASDISRVLTWVCNKRKVDVMFLLSKADSENVNIALDYKTFQKKLERIFSRFFADTNTGIDEYLVVPVGVVGIGNVHTLCGYLKSEDGIGQKLVFKQHIIDPDNIKTMNVASSFARALLKCFDSATTRTVADSARLEQELNRLSQNFGVVKNLIDILFFGGSRRQKIYSLSQQIEENRREILKLKAHKNGLERIALGSQ